MKFTDEYQDAISRLHPSSAWGFSDDKLNWQDDSVKEPTDEEIKAEITRYNKEFADNKWQRDRQAEYPTVQELVVALYDTEDKSAIEAKRAEVKKKYPKP